MAKTRFDFTGKVALVTGGGRGIGRAIALALGSSGASVALCSRTRAEIEAVAEEIRALGGRAMAVPTDLSVAEELERLVEETWREFGRIDILVNNAARSYLRALLELREDGWDKVFNTNLKAVWLLSRAVARKMIPQGGGRIVNITTVGAERAQPGMAAYEASKAALKALTRSMAREWAGHGINVNAVGPGLTRTEFSRPIWENPKIAGDLAARIPKGRLAEPEEIVGSVLFLVSDAADYVTGQSLYVDGGALT